MDKPISEQTTKIIRFFCGKAAVIPKPNPIINRASMNNFLGFIVIFPTFNSLDSIFSKSLINI